MSTFIESCCCHGIQPKGVVEKRRIARPEVVGLLLKDRSVPRFIIAPDGYGKTHVAFEYAGIMFAFEGSSGSDALLRASFAILTHRVYARSSSQPRTRRPSWSLMGCPPWILDGRGRFPML